MHLVDKHAKVIWYDSVTCDGTLAWQNELNDKNRLVGPKHVALHLFLLVKIDLVARF